MRYTKFTIKNYKGIRELKLNLDQKPSINIFTLVGLNESGKTSILEAINFFQHRIDQENAHTLIPKDRQHSFSGKISVEAELEANNKDMEAFKKYLQYRGFSWTIPDTPLKIEVSQILEFKRSKLDPDQKFSSIWSVKLIGKARRAKKEKNLSDWNKKIWQEFMTYIENNHFPKILYYQNFLSEFPEKIYLENFEGEGVEQKIYRDVIQDILTSCGDDLKIETDLLERMQNKENQADKEALQQLLSIMEQKLNEEVLQKWDAILGKTQNKVIHISDGKDQGYFIEIKIKQGSDIYSIRNRSLGFRWFFSFLIFTVFRKSRSIDKGETLFLLDEPASNLHYRSQQKLLESLENTFSDCKLIYSTHSPHLINPKWLAKTYIVKNQAIDYDKLQEGDITKTDISIDLYKNFVAQHPDRKVHFKPILDALDYVPSKLEFLPSLIFTEGKNDYYTFKYVAEVIFNNKYKLNFYPGEGAGSYGYIFRLHIGWNKKFIALFDSDKAGKEAKDRYIENIGCDLKNKIFTLKDINSEWENSETEKLFSEIERRSIIQTYYENDEEYTKDKFNAAILNLYTSGTKIDLSKETINKFKCIFESLKNKLDG